MKDYPRVQNPRTKAVHYRRLRDEHTWCGLRVDDKRETNDLATCQECVRALTPTTKHHITTLDDPVLKRAQDIGGDLPDGAFWALYHELGGG